MATEQETVGMSDEDFLNLPLPGSEDLVQREEDNESDASVDEEARLADAASDDEDGDDNKLVDANIDDDADKEDDDDDSDDDDSDSDDDNNTDNSDPTDDSDSDAEADAYVDDEKSDEEDASDDADKDKKDDSEPSDSDNWKALTEPFRANNSEMKVDNVADARRLMSMGANYHKKMVDMKEDRKIVETLRDNDLLDPAKLNLLIDASKGNKDALTKLLKQGKVNPLDIDVDSESDYTPNSYSTTDEALDLRDVLSGLRDTATYEQTMTIVTEKWDRGSQDAIMGKPDVLNVINDHVASGVYDIISSKVAEQKVLGKLNGLNDVQAYIQVGNELEAAGKFNDANKPTGDKETKSGKKSKPAPKKSVKPADKAKRKRANAPKQRAPKAEVIDFDNLSDEEFEKQFNKLNH
ncbi:MAG: hypothetical protein HRT86_15440 [Ilumatobacteraceae bacterium]|nr:hypothetical protein [Ilumatobacteraceae bacterium]